MREGKKQELPTKYRAGFIGKLDGRMELTKRLSFTYQSLIDDNGGMEALPHAKLCLAERFAFLEEFVRQMEIRLVEDPVGQNELIGKWIQAVNSMTGLSKLLGVSEKQTNHALNALFAPDSPPTAAAEPLTVDGPDAAPQPKKRRSRRREKGEQND